LLITIFAIVALASPQVNVNSQGDLLDQGYRAMYNLDFAAAHSRFEAWQRAHPEDPFGPVSDAAAYLFSEFDRLKILHSEFFIEDKKLLDARQLKPDPKIKSAFEADLAKSEQVGEALFRRNPLDERASFSRVVRIALHADYLALIEKQHWQALTEIKQAREYAEALVAKYPNNSDAYLAVGVENYLLSQKPAGMRLFLRMTGARTDKEAGLAKLRIVAEKGRYLKPYAKILLAIAALRGGQKDEAKRLLIELAEQFPHNDLFQTELKKLS
jgi:hypothetical protein